MIILNCLILNLLILNFHTIQTECPEGLTPLKHSSNSICIHFSNSSMNLCKAFEYCNNISKQLNLNVELPSFSDTPDLKNMNYIFNIWTTIYSFKLDNKNNSKSKWREIESYKNFLVYQNNIQLFVDISDENIENNGQYKNRTTVKLRSKIQTKPYQLYGASLHFHKFYHYVCEPNQRLKVMCVLKKIGKNILEKTHIHLHNYEKVPFEYFNQLHQTYYDITNLNNTFKGCYDVEEGQHLAKCLMK